MHRFAPAPSWGAAGLCSGGPSTPNTPREKSMAGPHLCTTACPGRNTALLQVVNGIWKQLLAAQKVWDLGNFPPSSQTFNAFLEPLAASFICPTPQSLLSTLLLHLLTLLALVRGQTPISRRPLHRVNVLPETPLNNVKWRAQTP